MPLARGVSGIRSPVMAAVCGAMVLLAAIGVAGAVSGALTVHWDANTTDSDLAGYRVFASTDSGLFALLPSEAALQASTMVVGQSVTEATFSTLDPSQVYWVAVTSIDTSGNESIFSDVVTGQPRDVTAPVVTLTSPGAGASVSGDLTVTASAIDDVGVEGVLFQADGLDLGPEDTTAPYEAVWSTGSLAGGPHTLMAIARDAAGNLGVSGTLTVNVNNPDTIPPAVTITAPPPGTGQQGEVEVTAEATDNIGVVGVQFKLDGDPLGAEDRGAPWSSTWDTGTVTNGPHTLVAVARDAAGNTTISAPVGIIVDNPDPVAPSVSIQSPIGGASLSGVALLSADAEDNVGVASVRFLLDGVPVGDEDTTRPFAILWPTTSSGNGSHLLTAVARDLAGNTSFSREIGVKITNTDTAPPAVSLTSPGPGATIGGIAALTASATDDVGVIGVQFLLDGQSIGPVLLRAPWTFSLDASRITSGDHMLSAEARDAAGRVTISAAVTVHVSNPAPPACLYEGDRDRDMVCDTVDNCVSVYNPAQTNTDGDMEGGDACDITVTFPVNGDVTCADGPPTITWSTESYDSFKVSVGATASFKVRTGSGEKPLRTASWTVPASKWDAICRRARPFLFIKVNGRSGRSKKKSEWSEVATIIAH